MSKPFTQNCFYCLTGTLTYEEVTDHVQSIVADAEAEIQRRSSTYISNCKFIINMPRRDGNTQRHCYLWITNKEVYCMLSGLNYDGRPIIEKEGGSGEKPALSAREQLLSMDWGDDSTSDFKKYVCPSHPQFELGPVMTERVNRSYTEGKLFCSSPLPADYPIGRLNQLFTPFCTSGQVSVQRIRNNAIISFSNKDDAYFALCMMRKTRDGDVDLSFTYCASR